VGDKMGKIRFFLMNEVFVNAENSFLEKLEEFSNPVFGPR
jgi:hypothetical protein